VNSIWQPIHQFISKGIPMIDRSTRISIFPAKQLTVIGAAIVAICVLGLVDLLSAGGFSSPSTELDAIARDVLLGFSIGCVVLIRLQAGISISTLASTAALSSVTLAGVLAGSAVLALFFGICAIGTFLFDPSADRRQTAFQAFRLAALSVVAGLALFFMSELPAFPEHAGLTIMFQLLGWVMVTQAGLTLVTEGLLNGIERRFEGAVPSGRLRSDSDGRTVLTIPAPRG
jgi:hypothetical protein